LERGLLRYKLDSYTYTTTSALNVAKVPPKQRPPTRVKLQLVSHKALIMYLYVLGLQVCGV
jgi:hypothetical protein